MGCQHTNSMYFFVFSLISASNWQIWKFMFFLAFKLEHHVSDLVFNRERIIVHIRRKHPSKGQLPMFEHADVWTLACSNISHIVWLANVWACQCCQCLNHPFKHQQRKVAEVSLLRLPRPQWICTIIRSLSNKKLDTGPWFTDIWCKSRNIGKSIELGFFDFLCYSFITCFYTTDGTQLEITLVKH